eukprot:685752-Prymnesium_polylepis.1
MPIRLGRCGASMRPAQHIRESADSCSFAFDFLAYHPHMGGWNGTPHLELNASQDESRVLKVQLSAESCSLYATEVGAAGAASVLRTAYAVRGFTAYRSPAAF